MSLKDNKNAPEYLHIPSHVPTPRTVLVSRHPLLYGPGTSTELNQARLPEPDELEGMDLAYRQSLTKAEEEAGSGRIGPIVLFSLLLPPIALLIAPALGFQTLMIASAGLALFSLFVMLVGQLATLPRVAKAFFGPPLAAFVLFFLVQAVNFKPVGSLLFSIITIVIFVKLGARPFRFYAQWLHTHPRLRPETRLDAERIKESPDLFVLVIGLLIAGAGSLLSPTLAIVGFAAWSIISAKKNFGSLSPSRLSHVWGKFISYQFVHGVPGVWVPHEKDFVGKLRPTRLIPLLVFSLSFTLSVSLSLFAPWDIIFRSPLVPEVGPFAEPLWGYLSSPTAWFVFIQYAGIWNIPALYWMLPVALAFAIILPPLFLIAVFGKLLRESEELERRIETLDQDGRAEWEWYFDRIHQSNHTATDPLGVRVREAEHLFLGVEPHSDIPILLDKSALSEHCYIVGETGSGKTALGVMPLLTQLIRGHQRAPEESPPEDAALDPIFSAMQEDDENSPCPPIIILDLKGDAALFHAVRREAKGWAERSGRDLKDVFQFFTPEPAKATYRFNPFVDFSSGERSLPQLAQLLLDSLGLSHGEGYGRSYYTRRNRQLLNAALAEAMNSSKPPKDIKGLYKFVANLAKTKSAEFKDAFELISTLHSLTQYGALVSDQEGSQHTIHMPSVLENRQIVYFWLPAAIESVSVREIGKMAIFSLLSAAIDRQRTGKPLRQSYLVIDEFQRLAGENFKVILEQARSFGIANILANQTQGDLKTADTDLRPTIRTNTRVKLYFSVSDPDEALSLSQSSGEELAIMQSKTVSSNAKGSATSSSLSDTLKPRIMRNDILRASDHPLEFILQLSRGAGYSQFGGVPVPVRTTYPLHKREYDAFQVEPWPDVEEIPDLIKETARPDEKEAEADDYRLKLERELIELDKRLD